MKRKNRDDAGELTLEALRLDHTQLTQEQFAVACDIPLATYQRMASKKTSTRLTPQQVANICRTCKISPFAFLIELGASADGIPNDE